MNRPTLCNSNPVRRPRRPRGAGFSMVELLVSLAITALLLTATVVAMDASFKSYASAAELASTQASSRLTTHRFLTMIRTSTAHGPLLPDPSDIPPVTISGNTVESHYMELLASNGDFVRLEYRTAIQELWAVVTPAGGGPANELPILSNVTDARFHCHRRENKEGLWVLDRGSIDLTIQPGQDNTLAIENGNNAPIRIIASTMPRKLN